MPRYPSTTWQAGWQVGGGGTTGVHGSVTGEKMAQQQWLRCPAAAAAAGGKHTSMQASTARQAAPPTCHQAGGYLNSKCNVEERKGRIFLKLSHL